MSKPVRVRRLTDEEGRQLQRIVRRGGSRSEKSIVKWRRAVVVHASAGGNTVGVIARLVATSEDRVREMIHRFNDMGMASLDPQWAGGRPRLITNDDVEFIVETATTRPETLGEPFTRWSIRKLVRYLGANEDRVVKISRERLRQLLAAHGRAVRSTAPSDLPKTGQIRPGCSRSNVHSPDPELLGVIGRFACHSTLEMSGSGNADHD